MEEIGFLVKGFVACMDPLVLLMCLVGAFLGVLVGVLPGLGPLATIAILMPLIFGRSPLTSVVMLAGIYYGAMFGGAITSISVNIPGESASLATTFDGYQMQKQGKGGKAIGISMIASFIGGTIALILLTFLAKNLSDLALKFSGPEYLGVYLFTFTAIICISKNNFVKGFSSLCLGLLISTVGFDAMTAEPRLDFGIMHLWGGIQLVPVLIGVMGLPETIISIAEAEFVEIKKGDPSLKFRIRGVLPNIKEAIYCLPSIIRSTLSGFVVGVMPGAGPTIATMIAYKTEEGIASDKKHFGKGSLQGVAAPEAANNAAATGAFVPALALGVPGSSTTALILSAFVMLGIQPGPMLFVREPELVWGLIASMYIGNVMLIIISIGLIPVFLWLLKISQKSLPVVIAVLCVVGTYSIQFSLFDVGILFFMTIVGLLLKKAKMPAAPLVLGLVLGTDFETSLRQSLSLFKGDFRLFSTRPIFLVLFYLSLLVIAFTVIKFIIGGKKGSAAH
jgi:putative tricarboxylic transport membrane protein